jgi:hypothetical protein
MVTAMISFLVFLQSAPDVDWTGDTIRTILIGLIGAIGGGILAMTKRGVSLLSRLADDVQELKRDIHGDKDGRGGLLETVGAHGEQIDWLWRKRYAQMVLEEAERESHEGPERRHHLRRERDIVNEAFNEDAPPFHPPHQKRKQ